MLSHGALISNRGARKTKNIYTAMKRPHHGATTSKRPLPHLVHRRGSQSASPTPLLPLLHNAALSLILLLVTMLPPQPTATAAAAAAAAAAHSSLPLPLFYLTLQAGTVFMYKYKKKKMAFDEANPGQVAMAWPVDHTVCQGTQNYQY